MEANSRFMLVKYTNNINQSAPICFASFENILVNILRMRVFSLIFYPIIISLSRTKPQNITNIYYEFSL